MATIAPLRPSPLAGTWYEASPNALASSVDQYLDGAQLPEFTGEVIGVVAPHAGHRYSGPVAGYAFAAIRGRSPDLVVVASPMHLPYNGALLTTAHSAYATPLGKVPVDGQAVQLLDRGLRDRLDFGLTPVAYDQEHSLEIELPFLQRALAAPFSLLPIMVRMVTPQVSRALGMALADVLHGRNCLLVASSDLSHYYSQPEAERMDAAMLSALEAFDPQALFDTEARGLGQACGLGALAAILWASRELGADTVKILRHDTSGTITGDFSAVVGYGAAAFLRSKS